MGALAGGGILSGSFAGLLIDAVLVILVLMSFLSWVVIVFKALQLYDAKKRSFDFSKIFWAGKDLVKAEEYVSLYSSSPLVRVFSAGFRELNRIMQERQKGTGVALPGLTDMGVLEMSLRRAELSEVHRLERGSTFLATVSSAAPFIGLFGTVLGIMQAFHGLGTAGSSTIQAVAPGISGALEATAIGLAAAIPASIAYNYISVVTKQFRESMDRFSLEFMSIAEQQYLASNR